MAKMGRPNGYNVEVVDEICNIISTSSKSMKTISQEVGIPVRTILDWLNKHEDFLHKYTRAKEHQADFLAEEIIDIADDSTNDTKTIFKDGKNIEVENTEWVNRSKLRVEARKWAASKLKPKKYGDKMQTESLVKIEAVTGMEIK